MTTEADRALEISAERCGVPGCGATRDHEDCCTEHATQRPFIKTARENDGVIDEVAIDLAVQGLLPPGEPLTWVEANIAAAKILLEGGSERTVEMNLGVYLRSSKKRLEEIRAIEEALRRGH